MISLSSPNVGYAGVTTSLMCSTIIASGPSPQDVIFEWSFGPDGNSTLPSGVAAYVTEINNNYTSILEFAPILSAHAGLYTCQFGGNQNLRESASVTVINDCESPN